MAAAAAARWPRFFVLRPAAALLLLLLLLLLHATAASPTTESGAGNATVARPDPCETWSTWTPILEQTQEPDKREPAIRMFRKD
uniref:Uncharacterized protein n=1 Tax=Oryza glumipatula TaxID=40148 RepID=A0A0D9YP45_9ORYZ